MPEPASNGSFVLEADTTLVKKKWKGWQRSETKRHGTGRRERGGWMNEGKNTRLIKAGKEKGKRERRRTGKKKERKGRLKFGRRKKFVEAINQKKV